MVTQSLKVLLLKNEFDQTNDPAAHTNLRNPETVI